MAIKVKKNTLSTSRINTANGKNSGSTCNGYSNGNGSSNGNQRSPQITPPRPSDNRWVIWVVLGGFVVIILCLCAAGSSHKKRRTTTRRQYVSRSTHSRPRDQLKKYEELDGKTMGQWMKDNKVNTRALRERRQRMLKHAYSRNQPEEEYEYETVEE